MSNKKVNPTTRRFNSMEDANKFYGQSIPELLREARDEFNVVYNRLVDNGFPIQRRTGLKLLWWKLMLRFR